MQSNKITKFLKLAVISSIAVVASISLSSCKFNGNGEHKITIEDVEHKHEKPLKRVIKVAYTKFLKPYDYINEKGKSDGLEVKIMQLVAKNLPQYEFKFIPAEDSEIVLGVESGKYNIWLKGAWYTKSHAQKYVIPKQPIAASIVGLVIRAETAGDIYDLDSFSKFSGKLVPISPINAQYNVIRRYQKANPDNHIDLQPSIDFNIQNVYDLVANGRYDAYMEVEQRYIFSILDENSPLNNLKNKLSYIRYKAFPTYPLFNRQEIELADAYDKAIKNLRDQGQLDKLEIKYLGEKIGDYLNRK